MAKLTHEVRDPVHQFVRFDDQERRVIDSPPVQRLRHIHQLATTYLVYPGATHRRFEHSRGHGSEEPVLGIEEGGLHSAESLLLARYFMFSQVYFHRVRRAYDVHLKDFLTLWLPGGSYSVDLPSHLAMTDVQVTAGIIDAASNEDHPAHDPARRLTNREHFRVLWSRSPADLEKNPESGRFVFDAAREHFGDAAVRRDRRSAGGAAIDFPVEMSDGRIASARVESLVIDHIPDTAFDYVFIDPGRKAEAERWLAKERLSILPEQGGNESDGAD